MAWLHQAAAASGPFIESEHPDKIKSASRHLAEVYTMLEKPFSAVPSKVDGTEKLRRVALGHKAYSLMSAGRKKGRRARPCNTANKTRKAFSAVILGEATGLMASAGICCGTRRPPCKEYSTPCGNRPTGGGERPPLIGRIRG